MKKLILLTFSLFLISCDLVEKDTRLICDCNYDYVAGEAIDCSDSLTEKNISLVFNVSKEVFKFGQFVSGGSNAKYGKDEITYIYNKDSLYISTRFNRINLKFNQYEVYEGSLPSHLNYQCRLTDGV